MAATAHVANKRTPGKLVADAGTFHQLLDGTNLTATGNSGWLDVGMIKDCQAHLELGTVTGTTPLMDLNVEIADDSSGNGIELVARFAQVADDDDTEGKYDGICIDKRWVRASYVISGTTPVFPATLTLRTDKDHYNTVRTGQVA